MTGEQLTNCKYYTAFMFKITISIAMLFQIVTTFASIVETIKKTLTNGRFSPH